MNLIVFLLTHSTGEGQSQSQNISINVDTGSNPAGPGGCEERELRPAVCRAPSAPGDAWAAAAPGAWEGGWPVGGGERLLGGGGVPPGGGPQQRETFFIIPPDLDGLGGGGLGGGGVRAGGGPRAAGAPGPGSPETFFIVPPDLDGLDRARSRGSVASSVGTTASGELSTTRGFHVDDVSVFITSTATFLDDVKEWSGPFIA